MPVVALNSDLITKMDAAPVPRMVNPAVYAGVLLGAVGFANKAAGDSATSTYRMVRLHSSWRLDALTIAIGALGTSGTINVGIYQTPANGGAFVNKTLFGSAIDVSAAYKQEIAYAAAAGDDVCEALWQRLGLTEDPSRFYDLVIELQHAGSGNAVIMSARAHYQK